MKTRNLVVGAAVLAAMTAVAVGVAGATPIRDGGDIVVGHVLYKARMGSKAGWRDGARAQRVGGSQEAGLHLQMDWDMIRAIGRLPVRQVLGNF